MHTAVGQTRHAAYAGLPADSTCDTVTPYASSTFSALALPGWLSYNEQHWNVRAERVHFALEGHDLPALEGVLYFSRTGRVVNPPLNPYLPFQILTTPTHSPTRLTRQWLEAGALLAGTLVQRGLGSALPLDPSIIDARPFQWAGLRESVRYTLYLDFPFNLAETEHDARKNLAKAQRLGYTCRLTDHVEDVLSCLASSEARQGFSHWLCLRDLELLVSLVGSEHVLCCVCYAPNGEPAAARVTLLTPGAPAVDWVGGTRDAHLHSGATQLCTLFAINESFTRGATAFDLAGANIHSVTEAKMKWRGRLVPYLLVQQYGLRSLARFLLEWRRAARLRGRSR